jgi:hypothetical protein
MNITALLALAIAFGVVFVLKIVVEQSLVRKAGQTALTEVVKPAKRYREISTPR